MEGCKTTNREKFKIEELFSLQKCSCKVGKKDITENGIIPIYSSETTNNGIIGYCNHVPHYVVDANHPIYLIFGDHTKTFHVADKSFCVADNVKVLVPKYNEMSKRILLYISTIWQKSIPNLGYARHWTEAKNVQIPLPTISDKMPDWNYMEQYMQNVEDKIIGDINLIISAFVGRGKIDTTTWRRFHLYDDELFIIDNGTKLDRVKMSENNPSINFVGRANANNGVTACVDKIDGIKPYDAGCLTISLGGEYLGSCFVQEKPFYTSQNVNVLIPKHPMSDYCKRFISTMIFREGRIHYKAFVDELNRHMRRDFSILLPVTSSHTPDWEYMEKYMQMIEQKTKNALYYLTN